MMLLFGNNLSYLEALKEELIVVQKYNLAKYLRLSEYIVNSS
jgi:hypothetical protein